MLRVFIWLCVWALGECNISPHFTSTHHNKRDKEFENINSIISKVDSQLRDIISTARSTTDETVESAKEVEEAEEENAAALKSVKARKEKEYKERMNNILGKLKQEALSKFSKGDVKSSAKRSWINRSNKCNKCEKCNKKCDKCNVVGGVKRLCVNSDGCCNCCCQHCCFCCECEPCYHHHHRYGSLCSHRHEYDDDMLEKNNNNNNKNNNNKVKSVATGAKISNGAGKVDDTNSRAEKDEMKSDKAASDNTSEKGKTTEKDGDKMSRLENLMNNLVTEKVTEGEKNSKRCKCSNGDKSKRCSKCSPRAI